VTIAVPKDAQDTKPRLAVAARMNVRHRVIV
jgi:hypothetical protein